MFSRGDFKYASTSRNLRSENLFNFKDIYFLFVPIVYTTLCEVSLKIFVCSTQAKRFTRIVYVVKNFHVTDGLLCNI